MRNQKQGEETQKGETEKERQEFSPPRGKIPPAKPSDEKISLKALRNHVEGTREPLQIPLASARREVEELKKGLKGALLQLGIIEANDGHEPPSVFLTVNGILHHVMGTSHREHPMQDATFLEWESNTD